MKRFAFLLAVLVSAVMDIETAEAQHTVTGDRRQVVITNPDGERVVDIRQPDDGRIVVRVASVEIVMNDNGRYRRRSRSAETTGYGIRRLRLPILLRAGHQHTATAGLHAVRYAARRAV